MHQGQCAIPGTCNITYLGATNPSQTNPDPNIVRQTLITKYGYDPGDPRDMSRDTTDGERLHWRLTTPDDLTPFLIDWGETPHPTTRGLPSLPLLNLSATHPDPQALAAVTNALEFDLPIHRADRPSLTATLRRPDAREVVLT